MYKSMSHLALFKNHNPEWPKSFKVISTHMLYLHGGFLRGNKDKVTHWWNVDQKVPGLKEKKYFGVITCSVMILEEFTDFSKSELQYAYIVSTMGELWQSLKIMRNSVLRWCFWLRRTAM